MSSAASSSSGRGPREARAQAVGDLPQLRHRRRVIGLREDRADDRRDRFAGALRHGREQVAHEVHAAPLPRAPESTVLIACFRPSCASEMTRRTPLRPRFTRLRRNAVQNARSSEGPTSMPSTWRSPSVVTPMATTVAWLITRPSTRTLWYVASTHR